ncbi:glycoside hydrolase family 95 protein [Shouchella patagoniensis]|uniref:glycoside hydrolase family 95 protein n=1 Tax=Shouchella patagoniensis TaxID=228576 RepID=UPI0009954943|nr:glycoside hydrolase family 95 protein [Shouchella patagoniensis]
MQVKEKRPAKTWTEAYPIGNGKMGAMVYGGKKEEFLSLNHDCLWSGPPDRKENLDAFENLKKIRSAIKEQSWKQVDGLAKQMLGPYTQSYLPFGELHLNFPLIKEGREENYKRLLDLETAMVQVEAGPYRRTIFASAPDNLIVIRLESNTGTELRFSASLRTKLKTIKWTNQSRAGIAGWCPEHVDPNYYETKEPIRYKAYEESEAIRFAGAIQLIETDGQSSQSNQTLTVEKATYATIGIHLATSFVSYKNHRGTNPIEDIERSCHRIASLSFNELYKRHLSDYQELYQRMTLTLKKTKSYDQTSTSERLKNKRKSDVGRSELLFQMGRYLLIASSREGSQPANLQGIWNPHIQAPWSSNYTLNINAQMNYWHAETAGLPECHRPLLHFIKELAQEGKQIATSHYGCRGWTAHHNSDIWRQAAPAGGFGDGDPVWALWPMSGPWLARHLWEQVAFSMDLNDLEKHAYPVLREVVLFCLDWLIEDDEGIRITRPSTSPEHRFITEGGVLAAVSESATMDLAVIEDVCTIFLKASEWLQLEDELMIEVYEVLTKLKKPLIDSDGTLLEWTTNYRGEDDKHRHLSHLYSVYPGDGWTQSNQPMYYRAAKQALLKRGETGTGWSLAWKLCLWARFLDGDHTNHFVQKALNLVTEESEQYEGGGVYPNLFSAHPPFQIDGNFGFTAGVIECLIQSHEGFLRILPAVPTDWKEGRVTGVRCRGGFIVDLHWENGEVDNCTVSSSVKTLCTLVFPNTVRRVGMERQIEAAELYSFEAEAAATYSFRRDRS